MRWTLFFMFVCGCNSNAIPGPDPSSSTHGTGSGGASSGSANASADASGNTSAGTGSTNVQGFESGTRLKARYYQGADGSKQLFGFYDSQRQENCGMQVAADGLTRCLPFQRITASGYFKDTGCTQLLALATCDGDTSPYVAEDVTPSLTACGVHLTKIYQRAAEYLGPIYGKSGASCVSGSLPPQFHVFDLAGEVTADSFVQATEQMAP